MRWQTKIFLVLVSTLGLAGHLFLADDLGAQPLLLRGGVDVVYHSGRFRLDVGIGAAGIDGFESSRFVLTVTPRYELRRFGWGRLDLTLPILWIPEPYPDPWNDPCPEAIEVDGPCGVEGPFFGVEAEELEVGPTIAVAPSLEWTFRTSCCFRPSIFVGAGLRYDSGRTTRVAPFIGADGEELTFTTEDTTSPLVTFGFALERVLSRSLALRFEARGITTFYDRMSVTGPGGSVVELDGDELTSAMVTVGLQFSF